MGYWTDALVWCFSQAENANVEAAIETAFGRTPHRVDPFSDLWAFTDKTYPDELVEKFKAARFPDAFYPPVLMVRGEQDEFWRVTSQVGDQTGCCHAVCNSERAKTEEAEREAAAARNNAEGWRARMERAVGERAVDLSKALRENTAEWTEICRTLKASLAKSEAKALRLKKKLARLKK